MQWCRQYILSLIHIYSTSAEVLESLRGKHEIIDEILEYRKLAKLKSTYVLSLIHIFACRAATWYIFCIVYTVVFGKKTICRS